MSATSMTAAINVSSMANRLLFESLFFYPARLCFHELTPEQEDNDDREQQIDDRERGKWDDQSGHRSHGISGTHKPIDDPGLSSEFGHKPAGLYCNQAERRGTHHRAQQPFVIRQSSSPQPDPSDPGGDCQHCKSRAHHNVEGQVHQLDVWPLIAREILKTDHLSFWIVPNQYAQPIRDLKGVIYLPTGIIRNSANHQRHARTCLIMGLHRCQLSWL